MPEVSKVFIQRSCDSKLPINETAYALWYGCQQLGVETQWFEFLADIQPVLRPDTVVHGWVSNVQRALRMLGKEVPETASCPPELEWALFRRSWPTTLGEIRKSSRPTFIKPLKQVKAFTGHVVSGTVHDLLETAPLGDDFEVLAQEPVEFLSEYRVFVHNGLLAGCRHYKGNFTLAPDFGVVRDMLAAYRTTSVGYALDVGVLKDGQTALVEINDAYSLGSYGQPPIPYTQMILDRWSQMASA